MSEVNISARAYCKIMLHAAKYPHLAVNGLLLGAKGNCQKVVDAVPLFHQCLHVTPMAEIALIQVEAKAAKEGLQILGYYACSDNFYENTIRTAPGSGIAEKIAENVSGAVLFAVIDNRAVSINMRYSALNVWQNTDEGWSKIKCAVEDSKNTFDAVSSLLQRGAMKELNDFDNYLDNTSNDWGNTHLNRDLGQILSMY